MRLPSSLLDVEPPRSSGAENGRCRPGTACVVAVVGFLLLSVGAALLVLPGPGLLVIAAGIAVLALEFPWAERLAKRIQLAVETSLRRLKLKK